MQGAAYCLQPDDSRHVKAFSFVCEHVDNVACTTDFLVEPVAQFSVCPVV
jgi:hypothetical protein